jgi:hypothetical protein
LSSPAPVVVHPSLPSSSSSTPTPSSSSSFPACPLRRHHPPQPVLLAVVRPPWPVRLLVIARS